MDPTYQHSNYFINVSQPPQSINNVQPSVATMCRSRVSTQGAGGQGSYSLHSKWCKCDVSWVNFSWGKNGHSTAHQYNCGKFRLYHNYGQTFFTWITQRFPKHTKSCSHFLKILLTSADLKSRLYRKVWQKLATQSSDQ